MTHLTRDDLMHWRDAPNPADRDRIILHLAECDECGAVYAELMRTRPVSAEPEELEPSVFMKAGAGIGPAPPAVTVPSGSSAMWRRIGVPLAAAAVLILGIATLMRPGEDSFRGGGPDMQLSAPSGTVDQGALTFEWSAPSGAPSQRLLVYALDDPSQPVVDAKSVSSPLRLTGEQAARLRPGIDYRWMIEQTGRDGRVETSAARGFRLR